MLLPWLFGSEYLVGVDVGEFLRFLTLVENIGQTSLVLPTIICCYSDSNGSGPHDRC